VTQDVFDQVPLARREIARAAIAAAIGAGRIGAVLPLSGGVSGALLFSVHAGERRYALRIEGPAGPLRNPHQYDSMRIAAAAGLAPAIHHLDERAGVVVMDLIAEQPLARFPGGAAALARSLGEMLRRLQALPRFAAFLDYPAIVGRIWAHVVRSGLFAPGVLDAHTRKLADIRSTYAWRSEHTVSSHNDLLPRNLLFDGHRLWLIDWESAYRNDPLVDVATALDNFAPSADLESELLRAWLGHDPDGELRQRLQQVRALTRLYYAAVQFSAVAGHRQAPPETDLSAPTVSELQQALRNGRLQPDGLETRLLLGKMLLAAFLSDGPWPGLPPPISQFQLQRGR